MRFLGLRIVGVCVKRFRIGVCFCRRIGWRERYAYHICWS